MGTRAIIPIEIEGLVDDRLKVYQTEESKGDGYICFPVRDFGQNSSDGLRCGREGRGH